MREVLCLQFTGEKTEAHRAYTICTKITKSNVDVEWAPGPKAPQRQTEIMIPQVSFSQSFSSFTVVFVSVLSQQQEGDPDVYHVSMRNSSILKLSCDLDQFPWRDDCTPSLQPDAMYLVTRRKRQWEESTFFPFFLIVRCVLSCETLWRSQKLAICYILSAC